MKASDILALAAAGFTAQQIAAINTAFAAENCAPPVAPVPAPATPTPTATAAPATPAPTATAAPAQPADPSAEILKQLGIISGQITAANIASSNQPPQQTADDILAEIIAPPKKEG